MLMSRPSQMCVVYLTQDLKIAFISPARDVYWMHLHLHRSMNGCKRDQLMDSVQSITRTDLEVINKIVLEMLIGHFGNPWRIRGIVIHRRGIVFMDQTGVPDETVIVAYNRHIAHQSQLEVAIVAKSGSPSRSPPPSILGRSRAPLVLKTITFRR